MFSVVFVSSRGKVRGLMLWELMYESVRSTLSQKNEVAWVPKIVCDTALLELPHDIVESAVFLKWCNELHALGYRRNVQDAQGVTVRLCEEHYVQNSEALRTRSTQDVCLRGEQRRSLVCCVVWQAT